MFVNSMSWKAIKHTKIILPLRWYPLDTGIFFIWLTNDSRHHLLAGCQPQFIGSQLRIVPVCGVPYYLVKVKIQGRFPGANISGMDELDLTVTTVTSSFNEPKAQVALGTREVAHASSPRPRSVSSALRRPCGGPSGLICRMRFRVWIHSSMSHSVSAASTK